MPEVPTTRTVGVTLADFRDAGTGMYEVMTTGEVPVRLHDMSLERLVHDGAARTLVMEFRYDDERSGMFALSAYTTYWVFTADAASIALRSVSQK